MNAINAEDLLTEYKQNKTRLLLLLLELEDIDRQTIEELMLPACILSHLPRNTTNVYYSRTESIAINYSKTKDKFKREIIELSKKIQSVDFLMSMLQDTDRYILEKRYFETNVFGQRHSWAQIAGLYAKHFNCEYIDKRTVRDRLKFRILPMLEKSIVRDDNEPFTV